MRIQAARLIPVRFSFPDSESRPDGWGRLTELSAQQAELLTRFKLERGDPLGLYFDLPGQRFENAQADVVQAETDADGYCVARLRFRSARDVSKIGQSLRDILAR